MPRFHLLAFRNIKSHTAFSVIAIDIPCFISRHVRSRGHCRRVDLPTAAAHYATKILHATYEHIIDLPRTQTHLHPTTTAREVGRYVCMYTGTRAKAVAPSHSSSMDHHVPTWGRGWPATAAKSMRGAFAAVECHEASKAKAFDGTWGGGVEAADFHMLQMSAFLIRSFLPLVRTQESYLSTWHCPFRIPLLFRTLYATWYFPPCNPNCIKYALHVLPICASDGQARQTKRGQN